MNKQHILDEIRRTADENGGAPLGVRRFEAETGIKESHWSGKYWARWGDAVREAGLMPNMLVQKRDADVLLVQLSTFIRELGRFPTTLEMRMRKRADDAFPNERHLRRGYSKHQLIELVSAFCERTPGWSDVAAICYSMAANAPEIVKSEPDSNAPEDGFVYLALMRVGREKRYKIGKANLVERRTRQVAVTLPEELELVHAIRTDDAYGIEAYWHNRFAEKRRGGEWFQLTADDVRAFKRRKFQ